jgi:hypothetical protein
MSEAWDALDVLELLVSHRLLQGWLDLPGWAALRGSCTLLRALLSEATLLPHQQVHTERLVRVLESKAPHALDMSATGRGKSVVAACVARRMALSLTVYAPPATLANWARAVELVGLPAECTRLHSYFRLSRPGEALWQDEGEEAWQARITRGTLLVLDEVHNIRHASKRSTNVARMVQTLAGTRSRVLALSATPCEAERDSLGLARGLGILTKQELVRVRWGLNGRRYYEPLGLGELHQACEAAAPGRWARVLPFASTPGPGRALSDFFTGFVRVLLPAISSAMPAPLAERPARVFNLRYDLRDTATSARLETALDTFGRGVEALENVEHIDGRAAVAQAMALVAQGLRGAEAAKVPCIAQAVEVVLAAHPGAKVVCMLNYLDPIHALARALARWKPIVLVGAVPPAKRAVLLQRFQEASTLARVIVANTAVADTGIDMDDTHGRFPRVMFISPTNATLRMHQAEGRIVRTTTRSQALVAYFFIAQAPRESSLLHRLARRAQVLRTVREASGAAPVVLPGEHPSTTLQAIAAQVSLQPTIAK